MSNSDLAGDRHIRGGTPQPPPANAEDGFRRSPARWDTVLAATAVISVILVTGVVYGWLPSVLGLGDPDGVARYRGLAGLRVGVVNDVEVDRAQGIVTAVGPSPYLVFEPVAPEASVESIRVGIRVLRQLTDAGFYVYFVPATEPEGTFSEDRKIRGVVSTTPERWAIAVDLPEPAGVWRLDIPPGAVFQVDYVELGGVQPAWSSSGAPVASMLGLGALLTLGLLGVQMVSRRVVPTPRTIKAILVVALLGSVGLVVFLLPPFQGPDENAHWQLALSFYRGSVDVEPAAYYLPESLESGTIAFNTAARFDPNTLRTDTGSVGRSTGDRAARHTHLLEQYPYVRYHSYPVMWLLSLLFPVVTTIQQALQWFYLARVIPAVLLLALLYRLNRRYELPYTAWLFFSLPLVVQQFVVISADTLLNLGAVIAVVLFLRLRDRFSMPLLVALWAVGLAMTYSKFITGGVLLLPLLFVPFRRIPKPRLVIGVGALLLAPAVYVVGLVVLDAVRDVGTALGRSAEVEQQIGLLGTTAGLGAFSTALTRYVAEGTSIDSWAGPLGWLDTSLSPQHVAVLGASAMIVVGLDVWAFGPRIARLLRTRPHEVVLLTGVAAVALVFAVVANSALFYLMTSPVGADQIYGMQMRHLFPAAILAVVLPLALLGRPDQTDASTPGRSDLVAATAAVVFLPLLLAAQQIELAIDLFTRYWT